MTGKSEKKQAIRHRIKAANIHEKMYKYLRDLYPFQTQQKRHLLDSHKIVAKSKK